MVSGRLPDFVIVGAMKAGSTTLFRRLDAHPGTSMPSVKEPNFFDRPRHGPREERQYRALFPSLGGVTGEASVRYSDPIVSAAVARRMAAVVPDVRLVFLARNPVDRLRSHYLHEVLRGRESRPLPVALGESDSPYVRRSCYFRGLGPFFNHFPREHILVIQSEMLDRPDTWGTVQHFLRLSVCPPTTTRFNESNSRSRETALMRVMRTRGLVGMEGTVPRPVRAVVRPLFLRKDRRVTEARDHARHAPLSRDVELTLSVDTDRFAGLLGWDRNPWGDH